MKQKKETTILQSGSVTFIA